MSISATGPDPVNPNGPFARIPEAGRIFGPLALAAIGISKGGAWKAGALAYLAYAGFRFAGFDPGPGRSSAIDARLKHSLDVGRWS